MLLKDPRSFGFLSYFNISLMAPDDSSSSSPCDPIFKWVARVDFAIQSKWTLSPRCDESSCALRARKEKGREGRDGITLHQRIHLSWRQPACSLAISNPGQAGRQLHTVTSILEIKVPPWTKRDGCMNSSSVLIGTKWKDRAVPKCCRYPTCSAP